MTFFYNISMILYLLSFHRTCGRWREIGQDKTNMPRAFLPCCQFSGFQTIWDEGDHVLLWVQVCWCSTYCWPSFLKPGRCLCPSFDKLCSALGEQKDFRSTLRTFPCESQEWKISTNPEFSYQPIPGNSRASQPVMVKMWLRAIERKQTAEDRAMKL